MAIYWQPKEQKKQILCCKKTIIQNGVDVVENKDRSETKSILKKIKNKNKNKIKKVPNNKISFGDKVKKE